MHKELKTDTKIVKVLTRRGIYRNYIKRLLDIICSILALFVLSPLFLIIIILVRINLGSPVFFLQKRIGKNGKEFTLYKFRIMTEERNENGEYLPDKVRLTPFGKKIRSMSIDELPQLINILKGDMSVIGPRPLPTNFMEYYTEEEKRRHEVRPGLSSLTGISGRNTMSWKDKFEKDVWYVDHVSFLLDCKIVLKTIIVVLKREGIFDSTGGTREDFFGTKGDQAIEKEKTLTSN